MSSEEWLSVYAHKEWLTTGIRYAGCFGCSGYTGHWRRFWLAVVPRRQLDASRWYSAIDRLDSLEPRASIFANDSIVGGAALSDTDSIGLTLWHEGEVIEGEILGRIVVISIA